MTAYKHIGTRLAAQFDARPPCGKLKNIARTVDYRARQWGAQLDRCEDDFDDGWWIF